MRYEILILSTRYLSQLFFLSPPPFFFLGRRLKGNGLVTSPYHFPHFKLDFLLTNQSNLKFVFYITLDKNKNLSFENVIGELLVFCGQANSSGW